MAVKTWKPHPVDLTIVEVLEKKGPMTDAELLDLLKETHEDLGFGMLNQILMRMEVGGKGRDGETERRVEGGLEPVY